MSTLPSLVFGHVVSPNASGSDGGERVEALAAWLRDHAKLALTIKRAPSYKALAASVRDGSTDLAWLPPVAYAWLAEAVTPIGTVVREGKSTYAATLVVRGDAEARTVDALKGLRAGWVDPWSAAGYVVPRLELAKRGIDPTTLFASEAFLGSHRAALRALAAGECDVVGTFAHVDDAGEVTSGAWSDLDGASVHVVATFGAIPSDVIAVRRNLTPADHEAATRALRAACSDDEGRALFRAVFGGDALGDGATAGHDALRQAYESGVARGLFD